MKSLSSNRPPVPTLVHSSLGKSIATAMPPAHEARPLVSSTSYEPFRAIRIPEVLHLTGDKKSHFYDRQNPKSPAYDATFPRGFRTSRSSRGPKVFWQHEIIAWLHSRAAASLGE